jgi:hypothetical protein
MFRSPNALPQAAAVLTATPTVPSVNFCDFLPLLQAPARIASKLSNDVFLLPALFIIHGHSIISCYSDWLPTPPFIYLWGWSGIKSTIIAAI